MSPGCTWASTGSRRVTLRKPRLSVLGSLGLLSLVAIVGVSLLIVLAAAERRSFLSPPSRAGFPHWMSGPLTGLLPGLTHDTRALKVEFSVAVASMYLFYLLALFSVRAVSTRAVLVAIAAVHVVFFLSPPLLLTDVFNYLNYARMGALHHLNPYVHVPASNGADPAYHFTTWHHLRSPYGPAFTLGTYALTLLGLSAAYWVLKAAVMSASLGCLALVWKCAQTLGRSPRAAVLFVGLNPLFLVYGLGGQHNDVFMMLLVTAAAYAVLVRRDEFGGFAIAAAVAVKASAGVLLPIMLLGTKRRGRAVAGAALGGAAAVALTFAAFGPHLPNDTAQSRLVVPFGLANDLGLALGIGGASARLRLVLELILVTGVLAGCLLAWRGRVSPPPGGRAPTPPGGPDQDRSATPGWLVAAGAVSLLLVLTLSWVMPWYVLWVLPFAALVRGRTLRVAAVMFGISLLVTWLPSSRDFCHDVLHIYPTRTSVGKQNSAYLHRFLR
jgi:alpha-1,6-mannosyltransferase